VIVKSSVIIVVQDEYFSAQDSIPASATTTHLENAKQKQKCRHFQTKKETESKTNRNKSRHGTCWSIATTASMAPLATGAIDAAGS
jgi:hypothetical protein